LLLRLSDVVNRRSNRIASLCRAQTFLLSHFFCIVKGDSRAVSSFFFPSSFCVGALYDDIREAQMQAAREKEKAKEKKKNIFFSHHFIFLLTSLSSLALVCRSLAMGRVIRGTTHRRARAAARAATRTHAHKNIFFSFG
jgi:hypothetical protein